MKKETPTDFNQETKDAERSDKLKLFRTIALIGIIALVVAFGSLKNLWRKSSSNGQPETSTTSQREPDSSRNASPIGENQTVRLKSVSDKIVVSEDGRTIVTLAESSVVAYRVGTSESILFRGVQPELFRNGDFLPNGDFVMGGESEVAIWDTTTGAKKMTLKAPGGVEIVTASPDGQTIAGVSREDGRVWIWETLKGSLIKESSADRNSLRPSIMFEDPGHLLIYEINQSRARVIRVEVGTMKFTPGEWQNGGDTNIKFGVRGKWLEAGSIERDITEPELIVFDGKTALQAGSIKLGENGSGEMVDERRALVVTGKGEVSLVDLEAGQITKVLDLRGRGKLVAVSKNGNKAVIKIGDREAFVYSVPEN